MVRRLRTLAVAIALASTVARPASTAAHEIDAAARAFLDALTEDQRADGVWPFADDERRDIHYAPLGLDGLHHGELDDAEFEAGERLLAATLSESGMTRVRHLRALEAVIREQESFLMRLTGLRDPGRYFWAFFGEPLGPPSDQPWAYRYEGHHLSINVTVTPGGVATTPLFIGSQPRVVPEGLETRSPAPGTAVLGEEERLARALYAALDPDARRQATLEYRPDRGNMIGQVARVEPPDAVGVARRDMTAAQQRLLDELVDALVGFWNPELAAARRAEVEAARDEMRFAHVEADEPPNSFYTRLAAPSLLIEIDNTEGGDHVHAVWHHPEGDFGEDLLALHLRRHHGIALTRTSQ